MLATPSALLLLADGDWNHMGGGAWVFMGLGMLIFWGLVIYGVVWLVRTLGGSEHRRPTHSEPNALDILDRSLAEGRITADEYRERRGLLGDQ
jgi:putative membrane protein